MYMNIHFEKVSPPDTDLSLSVYRHISFKLKSACFFPPSALLLLFRGKKKTTNNLAELHYMVFHMLDISI